MDKIKVFIKKSRPTSWYSKFIGKTIEVFDKEFYINDKIAFEYVKEANHCVFEEDILRNEEIRDRKLKRIIND